MAKWKKFLIDIPAALLIVFGGIVAFYNYEPAHTVITTVKHVPVKTAAQQYEIKTAADGKSAVISSIAPVQGSSSGNKVSVKPVVITSSTSPQTGTASGTTNSSHSTSTTTSTTVSSTAAGVSKAGSTTNVQVPGTSPAKQAVSSPPAAEAKNTVTISIKTLDGYLVAPETAAVRDGDTAFDVLKSVADSKGISIDYMGSGAVLYVNGIGGWEEKGHGPLSGWTYQINGVKGDRSAGAKDIKPGDKVEWIYVEK